MNCPEAFKNTPPIPNCQIPPTTTTTHNSFSSETGQDRDFPAAHNQSNSNRTPQQRTRETRPKKARRKSGDRSHLRSQLRKDSQIPISDGEMEDGGWRAKAGIFFSGVVRFSCWFWLIDWGKAKVGIRLDPTEEDVGVGIYIYIYSHIHTFHAYIPTYMHIYNIFIIKIYFL